MNLLYVRVKDYVNKQVPCERQPLPPEDHRFEAYYESPGPLHYFIEPIEQEV